MENAELLWKFFQEYASEARHHEQQRATVTGFFSALAAGVLTLVGMDKTLSLSDLPASLFLVVIGVFGCLFSAKQYERYYVVWNAHVSIGLHYKTKCLEAGFSS